MKDKRLYLVVFQNNRTCEKKVYEVVAYTSSQAYNIGLSSIMEHDNVCHYSYINSYLLESPTEFIYRL